MSKVTVIIPTLEKNKEYLKLCVESLRATVDWDIIVVSNGSDVMYSVDDIFGITKRFHTSTQGQCHAVNIGVQEVNPETEYLLISNDDMYYPPSWNKRLHFKYPVFSPNLVEPTTNHGSAPPFLKVDGGFTLDEFDEIKVDLFVAENTASQEPETGFNFPLFIRKDVWNTVEGYDENYDPWGSNSDSDLQSKIELAGITPMRLRDVLVYHFSNKSGTFEPENNEFWQYNFQVYKEKWGFDRADGRAPWYGGMIDYEKLQYHPEWEGKYKN